MGLELGMAISSADLPQAGWVGGWDGMVWSVNQKNSFPPRKYETLRDTRGSLRESGSERWFGGWGSRAERILGVWMWLRALTPSFLGSVTQQQLAIIYPLIPVDPALGFIAWIERQELRAWVRGNETILIMTISIKGPILGRIVWG